MTNTNKQNAREDELGVLWKRQSKPKVEGQKPVSYLSGKINLKSLGFDKDVELVIFKNKFKETDNQPDLRIYLSKPRVTANSKPSVAKTETKAEEPKAEEVDLLV